MRINLFNQKDMDFTSDEWLLSHKINALSFILFLASVILIIFVAIRFYNNESITALADLFGAFTFFGMLYFLNKSKKYYNIISLVASIIITIIITIAAFMGKEDIERSLWFFSLLIFIYFFRDKKEANLWLLFLITTVTLIHFQNGFTNVVAYTIFIFNILFMSTILYFYEKIKSQEQSHLTHENEILEKKVLERTQELDTLNSQLADKVKNEVHKNKLKDKMMAQQNKMAMMGEMIGNITHQFRQPLSAITASTSIMKFELDLGSLKNDEIQTKLSNIEEYVAHLSNTIEDFRNFFKEDKEKTTFNLSENIEKDFFIIESSYVEHTITLIREYDKNIEVTQFKNELTQCLLNILNNAKDALVEKDIKEKIVFIKTEKKEEKVYITITDNAGGIPHDILPQIFDDKFTTKDSTDGTGIGLYMTKQMIENHMDGKINAKNVKYIHNNEYYKGAQFTVIL